MEKKAVALDMMKFLDASKTPYHAVKISVEKLKEAGFKRLNLNKKFEVKEGKGYYIEYGTALIAFRVHTKTDGYQIIGSHTDSPAMMIKPKAVIKDNGYVKLNTEIYGGPILNTWMDRPLSLGGRVLLRSGKSMEPTEVLIDFEKPVAIIPNLAIHLNRDVNKGIELNKQKDMLPLVSLSGDFIGEDHLIHKIAEYLSIEKQGILDYELYVYDPQPSSFVGFNDEFISAPRIDNLSMLHASLKALIEAEKGTGIKMVVSFDNEEVGSMSRLGADSTILADALERIDLALGLNKEEHMINIDKSFMISADMAHAVHPNSPEKHDPTNIPKLIFLLFIKLSANKRYTTDGYSSAVFKNLCEEASAPYQTFVNPSDQVGGSTIGPISSSHLSIKSIDIGNPMLSMHSIRELCGSDDQYYLTKIFYKFFTV